MIESIYKLINIKMSLSKKSFLQSQLIYRIIGNQSHVECSTYFMLCFKLYVVEPNNLKNMDNLFMYSIRWLNRQRHLTFLNSIEIDTPSKVRAYVQETERYINHQFYRTIYKNMST